MKLLLVSLILVVATSCGKSKMGCGEFLIRDTVSLAVGDRADVYRFCDSSVLYIKPVAITIERGSGIARVAVQTSDTRLVLAKGEEFLVDSLNEISMHQQYVKEYKRYIQFIGVDSINHSALFVAVNVH